MRLAKAYAALPAGGSVIVHEALIDDDRRTNAFGLLTSLDMLIETSGGFDYAAPKAWGGCGKRASAKPARSTSSAPTRRRRE